MNPTVGSLQTRVQACLDDPSGKWADAGYLAPFIQIVSDDYWMHLAALNLKYDEIEVILPSVTAGMSDLSVFEAKGGALEFMDAPISLEWRHVGDPNTAWRPIPQLDKVNDNDGDVDGISSYEWRNQILYISPSNTNVDLRVRFSGLPPSLDDQSKQVLRGIPNILAYNASEFIAGVRNNKDLAAFLKVKGDAAEEDFEILMTKMQQKVHRKFGRNNMMQRSRLNWTIPSGGQ